MIFGRLRACFGRVNFGRLRTYFGQVNFGRVNFRRLREILAESSWPIQNILRPSELWPTPSILQPSEPWPSELWPTPRIFRPSPLGRWGQKFRLPISLAWSVVRQVLRHSPGVLAWCEQIVSSFCELTGPFQCFDSDEKWYLHYVYEFINL